MKTAFCILLTTALSCHSANGNKPVSTTATDTQNKAIAASFTWQTGSTPEGKWQLIPAMPSDTATGRTPFLNFMLDGKRVTGNTGCNSFSGTFNIEKNNLTFNQDFASTKMACPGYDEAAFERSLLRTNNFEIHRDTLCLKENETPLSYWLKAR